MLDLRIAQRPARLGLHIDNAQFELSSKKADLSIKQVQPSLEVERVDSNLEIDYSARLESMGFGGFWFMMQSMKLKSDEKFQENLQKTIFIGRSISQIEKKPSIGNIVFEAMAPPEQEVIIAATAPIKISYTPGDISFESKPGMVSVSVDEGKVSVENFTFPSIRVFLEQEPYLEIKAVGETIDLRK